MKDLNRTFRFLVFFFFFLLSQNAIVRLAFRIPLRYEISRFFPPPILALVSVLIILKRFFRRKNTVQLHGLQCYSGVQIKKKKMIKKRYKKEGREVKRFWPRRVICFAAYSFFLSLFLPLFLSP